MKMLPANGMNKQLLKKTVMRGMLGGNLFS